MNSAEGGQPRAQAEDWKEALELAYLWASYWEDDPTVHMDVGKVGFLARSFIFAMAHFGVISQPMLVSDVEEPV